MILEKPLCHYYWDNAVATVVCRMLGYDFGEATYESEFGDVKENFSTEYWRCDGSEHNLEECESKHHHRDCSKSEAAGVRCSDELEVELVDGTAPNEGNVMINGRHVCDENWNKEEAMVVCQMLGYASGEETTGSEFESVKDNNFIATNFFCDGSEQNLIECNLKANHLCSGDEAAGVRCSRTNHVIMVTGGLPSDDVGQHVELLSSKGTHICDLEDLPYRRTSHSQDGTISCGGAYTKDSCLIFSDGTWKSHGKTLKNPRRGHSSWTRGTTIFLIGGWDSPMTTEIISMDGDQQPRASFNLAHSTWWACVIGFSRDEFMITGGLYNRKLVALYHYEMGFVREMPSLNGKGRSNHACGQFINNQQQQVFIVAGGLDDGYSRLSSTEMLIGQDAKEWTMGPQLPSARWGLRAVSIGNRFLLTGGYDGEYLKDVLLLNEDGKNWTKTSMKYARRNHGVSTVPETIGKHCKK